MDIYRFYIYAYIRSKDSVTAKAGTPYYIGKGSNNRYKEHHGNVYVLKDRSKIVFLERNLSEIGAYSLERRYIRWYGRKDLGTGILHNRTDGGEGPSGVIGIKRPDLAEYNRTRIHPSLGLKIPERSLAMLGSKNPNYGKKTSKETLEKMSKGLKDFYDKNPNALKEIIDNLALINKGSKWWNNGIINKRSKTRPGEDFFPGYISSPKQKERFKRNPEEHKKLVEKAAIANKSRRWWTDGFKNILSKTCPGEEYKLGRIIIKPVSI